MALWHLWNSYSKIVSHSVRHLILPAVPVKAGETPVNIGAPAQI